MSVLVIAEAGVNYNGSLDTARRLADAAKEAGADIVKFQTFKAEGVAVRDAPSASYQVENIGEQVSQFEMIKSLEMSFADFERLVAHCEEIGIEFLSTAFDWESFRFLADEVGQRMFKIPSGELTNAPFVLAHAQTGRDLILSTGMADLAEIEQALGVIAFGAVAGGAAPDGLQDFAAAYRSEAGQAWVREHVTVLHCTSQYPAPLVDVNLAAMDLIRERFGVTTGYSDHTLGITVSLAAVARGAAVIEKHFTLDRSMPGPDHVASLEPGELGALVRGIRDIEVAIGEPVKRARDSELEVRSMARRSLVATRPVAAGEVLTPENVGVKRPGTGMSPYDYWSVLGRRASRDYAIDGFLDER